MVSYHSSMRVANTDEKLTCTGHISLSLQISSQEREVSTPSPGHHMPRAHVSCIFPVGVTAPYVLLSPHCIPRTRGCQGASVLSGLTHLLAEFPFLWLGAITFSLRLGQHPTFLKVLLRETKSLQCFRGAERF